MQESEKGVFVVFTLNNMSVLPRELVDRFEGRFFFLLSEEEREAIFKIHVDRFNRNADDYDLKTFVKNTDGFNGRGIEAAVSKHSRAAFADEGREPTNNDFVAAFEVIGPAVDQKTIEILREEAKAKSLMTANRGAILLRMRILKLWTFLEYENVLVRWTNRWDLDGPVSFWNAGITGSRANNMEWTYSRYL